MTGHSGVMELTSPSRVLPVASITAFVDQWLDSHSEAKIDYMHDLEVIVIVTVNTQTQNQDTVMKGPGLNSEGYDAVTLDDYNFHKCAHSSEISMDPVTFKRCRFFIFFLKNFEKLNLGEQVRYGRGAPGCGRRWRST